MINLERICKACDVLSCTILQPNIANDKFLLIHFELDIEQVAEENRSLAMFSFPKQGLPPGNISGTDSFLRLFSYFLWNMFTGHGVKEAIYFCVATRGKWTNRVSCIWHGTSVICAGWRDC